jgi:hypothetical protein
LVPKFVSNVDLSVIKDLIAITMELAPISYVVHYLGVRIDTSEVVTYTPGTLAYIPAIFPVEFPERRTCKGLPYARS